MRPTVTADRRQLDRHLNRLRLAAIAFLASLPIAAAAGYVLPRLPVPGASPLAVTLVLLAIALWLAFTADAAAARRLDRACDDFVDHRDEPRLLAAHRRVYYHVLLRLWGLSAAGLGIAVAGSGPRTATFFHMAAALLGVLAWPTEAKTRALLRRAWD